MPLFRPAVTAVLALLCIGASTRAQFQYFGIPGDRWGAPSDELGTRGMTIEDFEDVVLDPGLRVRWIAPAGNVGPVTVLPSTFDPATNDAFGNAFVGGNFLGTRCLINCPNNVNAPYSQSGSYGDIEIVFDPPVRAAAFSLHQSELNVRIIINGVERGNVQGLTGLDPGSFRIGYIVIEASGEETISTLRLGNGVNPSGDGFTIDRLAFTTAARPQVVFTPFNASVWPRSDDELGVTSLPIENFEDLSLVPGLQITWNAPDGNAGPTSTLPALFDPTLDAFGNAFVDQAWDGLRGVINTRTNQSFNYAGTGSWGDISFSYADGAGTLGFSIGQMQSPSLLLLNGRINGYFASTGVLPAGGRQGYLRIDATGTPIDTLRLNNTRGASGLNGDGFIVDHMAVSGLCPVVTVQPSFVSTCPGGTVTLLIKTAGLGPFTYQWKRILPDSSRITLTNTPPYADVTTPTLTITECTPAQTGDYECIVTNACGPVATLPITVAICTADFNCDGLINSGDYIAFLLAFAADEPIADIDASGAIDSGDYLQFLLDFAAGC